MCFEFNYGLYEKFYCVSNGVCERAELLYELIASSAACKPLMQCGE